MKALAYLLFWLIYQEQQKQRLKEFGETIVDGLGKALNPTPEMPYTIPFFLPIPFVGLA